MVRSVDLDVAARLPGPFIQQAARVCGDPFVGTAVHHQQRPRALSRDNYVGGARPGADLGRLLAQLGRRGRQEPGERPVQSAGSAAAKVSSAGAAMATTARSRSSAAAARTGSPAAQAMPSHGKPIWVDAWSIRHPAGDRRPRARRAGLCAGHSGQRCPSSRGSGRSRRVPAAVAKRDGNVEVLLQARAAVQEQDRRLGCFTAGQVQHANEPIAGAVEGYADDALVPADAVIGDGWPVSIRRCRGP